MRLIKYKFTLKNIYGPNISVHRKKEKVNKSILLVW